MISLGRSARRGVAWGELALGTALVSLLAGCGGDNAFEPGGSIPAGGPEVTFEVDAPERAEISDEISVRVAGSGLAPLQTGFTLRPILLTPDGEEVLPALTTRVAAEAGNFTVGLGALGLPEPFGSADLRLEVTAFVLDRDDNCAAATIPGDPMSEECSFSGDTIFASGPGSSFEIALVRTATVRTPSADRLAHLVADTLGQRVFVSNFDRNQLEVLNFGESGFSSSIPVGSQPWGLMVAVTGDVLYAANSGGTNISVISLQDLNEVETLRLQPADLRLYGVEYDLETDSVTSVTVHEYSDRPQFLGQLSGGEILYSTMPTSVRTPGTIRIVDPAQDQTGDFGRGSEVLVDYAAAPVLGRGIVVNALSASHGSSIDILNICPRPPSPDQIAPACLWGTAREVRDSLAVLRQLELTDTRLELGRDMDAVALTDTTFVAVSGDHSTIAFGEGNATVGRVFLFEGVSRDDLRFSLRATDDLLGNAAERVSALGLNADGTLGVATGQGAYFFDHNLRLQGQVQPVGSQAAAAALHPRHSGYPRPGESRIGFVAGTDSEGAPYIDVVDTFFFRTIRRIGIRDEIIGDIVVVPVTNRDPAFGTLAVRLFGISESGVVQLGLTAADLSFDP